LKWLFSFLLLMVVVAFVLYGLKRFGYIDLPLDQYPQVEKLFEGSHNTIKVEPLEKVVAPPLPLPPPIPPKQQEKKSVAESQSPRMSGGYFLKIGACITQACQIELRNRMKALKLPLITQNRIQRTTYFELISATPFSRKRAEEKLRLLNKYNKTNGFPFLLPGKNHQCKISFGQFPDQADGLRMKSNLEHLYPQIRIRFLLNPRKDHATITEFYVGPFNKQTAEKTKTKLQRNPDSEWIEIIKRP
ncbi:MAG: hypothetical protein ABIK68_06330, partial [bacterium]